MKTTLSPNGPSGDCRVALISGTVTVVLGAVVLVGWAIHSEALKTVFPGLVTMKANTALGLVLCGGALSLLSGSSTSASVRLVATALAATAIALGLLTLCEYFFEWNLGIDELLFQDANDVIGTSGPGRMAPSTAFCFAVDGLALALASQPVFPTKIRFPVVSAIGATLLVIGGVGTLGQLSNGLLHLDFWNFSGMAIHTAIGFVFLGAGLLLLVRCEQGVTWALDVTATLGFVAAVAVMLSVAGVSWNYTYRLKEAGALVTHSSEELRQIENIRSGMANLESSQRGYVITGDEHLIAQRADLQTTVQKDLGALHDLTTDNRSHQELLGRLARAVAARTAFGDEAIELRRQQGFPAAQSLITTGAGLALTDEINRLIASMRDSEYALLLERQKEVGIAATSTFLLLPSGIFLSLTILSLALFFLNAGMAGEKQTREKLRASLKDVGDLQHALDEHAIVAITDPLGRITYVNDKFCEISRYSRAELIGQDHRIVNSGYHAKAFIRNLWGTISQGQVWHGELKNRAKGGSSYWVDTTIVPFLNATGQPRQYVAIRTDITERKLVEESSRLLASIVNCSNDAIISKDLNSIVTSWNAGAERIFGYTTVEMLGQSITRLIPPHRREEETEIMAKITKGQSVENFETIRAAKDGRLIDISVTISPIRNHAGRIVGASKVARDITEQKAAQEALNQSEKQFRTMIDSIPQLTWMAEPDGRIFCYNKRWFDYTGTTPEKMEGWGWKDVHDPAFLPKVMEGWTAAIATGDPFEMEFPLRAANGTFGWFLTRVFPIKDDAGKVVRWFGTNTDLSLQRDAAEKIRELNVKLEQRVAERTAELEAANKELEAFSYSVSHDLRSPLRAVDGFSQAVLEDFAHLLPEQGRKDLQTIRSSAQRMGRLIDDLLAFSRLGRTSLKKHEINTTKLVRSVLAELGLPKEGAKAEILVGELQVCQGDPALLNQVWVNLLSNAFKYSSNCPAPLIQVGSRLEEGETVFFVRDNGAGFDMRYAAKLFGVFQRLHRLDEFEGTGVGLAIVQRIIQRHGGRIWADAKPNAGATFHFTLSEERPS
jgi:PAS domain S-box-containing protein